MKILNFGSCNIDYVYSVDHIASPGETLAARDLKLYCGGKGLNQSIALARAGSPVFHAGCVGEDGEQLRKIMLDSGVDLTYLKTVGGKSGHAIIQVDGSGNNSIMIFGGANGKVSRDQIDSVLDNFERGDYIILQNEISGLDHIIKRAAETGMKIFLNPSPFDKHIADIPLDLVFCMILNETEAEQLSGESTAEGFCEWIGRAHPGLCAVLTLGENGSIWIDGDTRIRQSAFSVNAVDTTAAGDTFTGYFVSALSKTDSPEYALRIASAAAAVSVSRSGAAPSIPCIVEVKAQMVKMKESKPSAYSVIDDYIGAHLHDATLDGLAAALGYNRNYASSWIKANAGASFSELLRKKRCKACAVMLETGDLPVSRIIELCGYKNESFLRRAFKEEFGCTPYEYRKKVKRNAFEKS